MGSILLLGGARSGKSRYAQELALRSGKCVLFVATATAGDDEMAERIQRHRQERPADWITLEAPCHVGCQISRNIGEAGVVILDCITLLLNNIFAAHGDAGRDDFDVAGIEKELDAELRELEDAIKQTGVTFIIVSNEVGLGLVPANRMGRLYRDLLGRANQLLARQADEVYLLVAGIPLPVKSTGKTGLL